MKTEGELFNGVSEHSIHDLLNGPQAVQHQA